MAALAATMASLTGVSRIDEYDRHASGQRFVGDELPQLVERPTFLAIAVLLAALGPLANASQFLKCDCPSGPQSEVHETAADDVVDMGGVFPFAAGQPFQEATRLLRAFPLNGSPDFGVVFAEPVYLLSFVDIAIRIDSHASPSQIDAKDFPRLHWFGRNAFDLNVQEVASITALDEHGTGGRLPLERCLLSFAELGFQTLPRVEQGQGEGPIPFAEGEDALVVINTGRGERRVHLLFDFEGGADAGNSADGQVGRQAELFAERSVGFLLHLDLVGRVDTSGNFGDAIASMGEDLQGGVDFRRLFGRGIELADDGSDSFHTRDCITRIVHIQGW